jgi:hypothetical protein
MSLKPLHVVVLLGCGCLVVCVAATIALVLGFGWAVSEPEDVTVRADAPLEVPRGERFQVVAVARNGDRRARRLVDLDVADEYLRGIVVEGSEPPFDDAMHVPLDNTVSHSYGLEIAPGQEVRVVFTMYAAHAGDYSGDIDFCIDSEVRCLSYPVRTIVR